MRKLKLLLLALLFTASAYASPVTDTWGPVSQGMNAYQYNSGYVTDTESGAEYYFSELYTNGFGACFMKPGDNAYITVTKPAGNVRSITLAGALGNTSIAVYGSSEPITLENIADATPLGQLSTAGPLDIEGDYPYVALRNDSDEETRITELSFTWEQSEPPVPVQTATDTWGPKSQGMNEDQLNSGYVTDTESGAEYYFSGLRANMWGACFMLPGDNAYITVTKSAGNVRSIACEGGIRGTYIAVYGSSEPITPDNIADATLLGQLPSSEPLDIEGDYPYVALRNDSEEDTSFTELSFTWEQSEPPVPVQTATDTWGPKSQGMNEDQVNSGYVTDTESGAEYYFSGLRANMWGACFMLPGDNAYITVTKSAGNVRSIACEGGIRGTYIAVYGSSEPITPDNIADATLLGQLPSSEPLDIEGDYPFVALRNDSEEDTSFTELSFTWETKGQVQLPTAATPEINCWAQRFTAGSVVYVTTQTENATLNVDVYVNNEKHYGEGDETTSAVHNGSEYTFLLPGQTGDVVRVEAYTSKEGYLDSDKYTREFTIAAPKAEQPAIEGEYPTFVLPAQELSIYSETENATISYTYGLIDYNDASNNWTSDELSGASPVKITVPDTAKEGTVFFIEATATADGYAESDQFSLYTQVKSTTLPAPTFSIASGREVVAGTKVTITRPDNATTIHYTVNGAAEQTSAENSVEVEINEATTIEAWVSGDAPFVDSDKVTATYTILRLDENTDAITPQTFTSTELNNSTYANYTGTGASTGFSYSYDGGFWVEQAVPCFYLDSHDANRNKALLYNNEGRNIKRVKLETAYPWSGCYIMFANEPITYITDEMKGFDYIKGRLRIINDDDRADFGFDEWIDLSTLESDFQDCKYFAIWIFDQNSFLSRVLVEYEGEHEPVGIGQIEGNSDDCRMFDINGIEVNPDSKLAPGIYVRVSNGKASKTIVK